MFKRLVILAGICGVLASKGADVTLNLVSSNQFKTGTNGIYLAALSAIASATNIGNYFNTNKVSVLSYGAIPDGSTDNQSAISNAWINTPNPGTLVFAPGVYKATRLNLFTAKNNFTLEGNGATLKPFDTNLWVLGIHGTNILIKDFTIDGDSKSFYGILQQDYMQNITYQNCKFLNFYVDNVLDPTGVNSSIGVNLQKGWKGVRFITCLFSNITYSATGYVSRTSAGIAGGNTGVTTNEISLDFKAIGNTFDYIVGDLVHDADCIRIQTINNSGLPDGLSVGSEIVGNYFYNYVHRAVKAYGDGWNITGNFFQSFLGGINQLNPIGAFGSKQVIANNIIIGNFYKGITTLTGGSLFATNILISGNIFHSTATPGTFSQAITVDDNSTNVVIRGNIVSGNVTNAIQIVGPSDTVSIVDNTIQAFNYGILVATNGVSATVPKNIQIARNKIITATTGIYTSQGSTINIENNRGTATGSFIDVGLATSVTRFNNGTLPAITSATLDFGSINAAASADLTITVSGAATGDPVALSLPAAPAAGIIFNCFVSSANTVTVRASNITASPVDPASASYKVEVFKD